MLVTKETGKRRTFLKRKYQRKAEVGGILPPRGVFSLCAQTFFFASFKSFLSDGKDNNEQCTSASLHLLEGEGDRVAVEGVKPLRKLTEK